MKSTCSRTTVSGASVLACSAQRACGTAADSIEPMPPSPTRGSEPSRSMVRLIPGRLTSGPMRLISFTHSDGPARAGVMVGGIVRDTGLSMRALLERGLDEVPTAGELTMSELTLLPPVPDPSKILCIGRNYREHAEEQSVEAPKQPLVFAKMPSSLIAHGTPIVLSPLTAEPDWEAELAAVIGTRCSHVAEADALGVIAGYTCLNDVSARDLQRGDGQWTRAKGLDTFCPMGPELVSADEVGDPQDLEVRCLVNGETMQRARTDRMIHGVATLVAHLS